MLKSSVFLASNNISYLRLSEQALGECILKDIKELGKLIDNLWKLFVQFFACIPVAASLQSFKLLRERILRKSNDSLTTVQLREANQAQGQVSVQLSLC